MKTFIDNSVKSLLKKASDIYGFDFDNITIDYSLKGTRAGVFHWDADNYSLRFNLLIAKENKDSFYNTIVHEVAHYIVRVLNYNAKPHGKEWKAVMNNLGIKNPQRCHSYSIPQEARTMKYYNYSCDCGLNHELSQIKHNKIKRGDYRICAVCKSRLFQVK